MESGTGGLLALGFAVAALIVVVFAAAASAAGLQVSASGSPASRPAASATPAVPPESATATYAGTQVCLSCHQQSGTDFQQTMMGNILIKHPRNSDEQHGCESCHGP